MPISETALDVLKGIGKIVLIPIVLAFILLAWFFPYDSDSPLSHQDSAKEREYYAKAFAAGGQDLNPAESAEEERYVTVSQEIANAVHIEDHVRSFVSRYGLASKKALDVGSGRGYLQDMVADYTGIDISASASRFYHKKFVLGSATSMPFEDNSFDAVWSIWVLEHVPNPEQALDEIRRVSKDGAMLYLRPAWDCQPYLANGYNVRPYSDFGLWGKLTKILIPERVFLHVASRILIYPLRDASWKLSGQPTRLRYHRLNPNYKTYWGSDSDAVNSLDPHEVELWFRSRGDECLNCTEQVFSPLHGEPGEDALIIKIHKGPPMSPRT